MNDDGAGWEQQQDNERRRWDEEQTLKADAAYEKWLMQLAAQAANEQEKSYVDYCQR